MLLVKALSGRKEEASRLWALAEEKLALAVNCTTDSQASLLQWANLLFQKAKRRGTVASRIKLLKVALTKFFFLEQTV